MLCRSGKRSNLLQMGNDHIVQLSENEHIMITTIYYVSIIQIKCRRADSSCAVRNRSKGAWQGALLSVVVTESFNVADPHLDVAYLYVCVRDCVTHPCGQHAMALRCHLQ